VSAFSEADFNKQNEREHLLNNDNTMQYGTTGGAARDSCIDPENLRRQEERLARLVQHTNEYVPPFPACDEPTNFYSRLIYIAPTTATSKVNPSASARPPPTSSTPIPTAANAVKFSRDDRILFEEVAFGDVHRPEETQNVSQLGCINVPVVAENHSIDPEDQSILAARGSTGVIRKFVDLRG
jgi:hypothetical protein